MIIVSWILIISGIMIALYPPLLSLIVAGLFISAGVMLLIFSYKGNGMSRGPHDPFGGFFEKYGGKR